MKDDVEKENDIIVYRVIVICWFLNFDHMIAKKSFVFFIFFKF